MIMAVALATEAPIIGLLSLPVKDAPNGETSFVQGEAVKWIEASGARVTVLKYDDIEASLDQMDHLNGLMIPSLNGNS